MARQQLPPTIEENLAKWIVQRGSSSFPLNKADVLREARTRYARHFKVSKIEVRPFSYAWLKAFGKRHPETDGCWGDGTRLSFIVPAGYAPHVDKKGNFSMHKERPALKQRNI